MTEKHGKTAKICRGKFHQSGVLLPIDQFYIRQGGSRKGIAESYCRRCYRWNKDHPRRAVRNGTVSPALFLPVLNECYRRLGVVQTAKRMGVVHSAFGRVYMRGLRFMRSDTFERLLDVLFYARERGEDNFDAYHRLTHEDRVKGGHRRWELHRLRLHRELRAAKRRRGEALDPWEANARYVVKRYPLPPPPDKLWWHDTGMELLPRFGEEMLGDEF